MIDWIIGIVGVGGFCLAFIMLARIFDPYDPYGKH